MSESFPGTLKELVDLVANKTLPESGNTELRCINLEDIPEGAGRIVSWTQASDNLSIKTQFQTGDVLFGKLRPYLRKFALANFDGVCTTEILAFRPKEGVDPNFVYQVVSSDAFIEHNVAVSYGTKMPRTDWKTAASFPVLIPSKREQQGIAEVLSALDEQIEATETLIAKFESVRSGLYASLRDAHPPTIRIGEHFNLTSGMTPLRSTTQFYGTEGVPWVKTLDLNEGRLFETDEKVTTRALAACSLRVHPAGTVLIAMYGGWLQIGRTALLATEACTNQAITSLTPKAPANWNPYFVMKALQAWRHKWRDFAVSTRKDPNITKSDIGQFMLPMPEIAEQTLWAESLESADELIETHKAEVAKLRLQKRGLMRDLLTGKTRVLQ